MTEASDTVHPIYFGPPGRPLFGWLHRPARAWSGVRVVLCPALGYEGLFAHPSFRELARRLSSDTQAVVLRFDYDGTGDSAGSDEDPDRVGSWLDSIDAAIDTATRLAPSYGPVILIGLRAGATLAAAAAGRRRDVSALVLWAPCLSGKEFVREQRAFALLAHATAGGPAAGHLDWGAGGFEANGYVYSADTVDGLSELSLAGIESSPAPRVLLLDREESPCRAGTIDRWQADAAVEHITVRDYGGMIEPPLSVKLPEVTIAQVVSWIGALGASGRLPLPDLGGVRGLFETSDFSSQAVWYDDDRHRFGILTRPRSAPCGRVLLVLNNAAGNRVGPHGMVPGIARSLAAAGVATFRVDLAGVGDSELPENRRPHHPYDLEAVEDVQVAVAYLKRLGFAKIAAGGLCSAAYLAWHAAQAARDIDHIVLINPQTFEWKEGDSLDVSPLQTQYEMGHYRNAARSGRKWLKLVRGQVSLTSIGRVLRDRVMFVSRARARSLKVALGIGGARSPTARAIGEFGRRGGVVSVIFGGDDPGIAHLHGLLGGAVKALVKRGYLRLRVIEGPDHSFTPRWATRELIDALTAELAEDDGIAVRG